MKYSSRFVFIPTLLIFLVCAQSVQSQSTEKFEVGGQVTLLRFSNPTIDASAVTNCILPPCFTLPSGPSESQLGFGARFAYNITPDFAVEAEFNFFPDVDSLRANEVFDDGFQVQGLFGPKVGKRFRKVGIFAKARPGFMSMSKGELAEREDVACITIFPPPASCFRAINNTHFAVDVGGVFEIYPSKRMVIRFDAGDTMLFVGDRLMPVFIPTRIDPVALPVAGETTHNFQATFGLAYRF